MLRREWCREGRAVLCAPSRPAHIHNLFMREVTTDLQHGAGPGRGGFCRRPEPLQHHPLPKRSGSGLHQIRLLLHPHVEGALPCALQRRHPRPELPNQPRFPHREEPPEHARALQPSLGGRGGGVRHLDLPLGNEGDELLGNLGEQGGDEYINKTRSNIVLPPGHGGDGLLGDLLHEDAVVALRGHPRVREPDELAEFVD
mmetsp:Transcript_45823/g.146128  ORF Transcript_45823/g.146128 Transcript_45823/m.146128 type:complete len:200 (-) Transcript_45823:1429-2028(-)